MTQPKALFLADVIEADQTSAAHHDEAAAELRRLHQFAEDQIGRATAAEAALQMTKATHALKIAAVEAQRDALLEALRAMRVKYGQYACRVCNLADAAIKAVEGESHAKSL